MPTSLGAAEDREKSDEDSKAAVRNIKSNLHSRLIQ